MATMRCKEYTTIRKFIGFSQISIRPFRLCEYFTRFR